jgi:hypothetical protein
VIVTAEPRLDDVLARREMVVAVADGEITAAALLSDWLVAAHGARLTIGRDPALVAALVWRIAWRAHRLHLLIEPVIESAALLAHGVADALVPPGEDSVKWVTVWIGGRSALALDSAAALLRRRGGDDLERAEFARLFAIGEPQIGLAAFLARRKPEWLEPR